MGTKRIFIAGHGAMLNDETITETIDESALKTPFFQIAENFSFVGQF